MLNKVLIIQGLTKKNTHFLLIVLYIYIYKKKKKYININYSNIFLLYFFGIPLVIK